MKLILLKLCTHIQKNNYIVGLNNLRILKFLYLIFFINLIKFSIKSCILI